MSENTPAVRHLPKYEDLIKGDLAIKQDQNDLNLLLNCEPPKEWLKKHPFAKKEVTVNGHKVKVPTEYLPIERVEALLTAIFIVWNVEIKSVQVIANAVTITVRLYYQDVLSDRTLWQDGVGAAPIQTDSGAGAMDWNKTKSDAVMKAAPAAESYAVKDAAEKIGKIFGKDLNRADQIVYDELAKFPKKDKLEDLDNETNND